MDPHLGLVIFGAFTARTGQKQCVLVLPTLKSRIAARIFAYEISVFTTLGAHLNLGKIQRFMNV